MDAQPGGRHCPGVVLASHRLDRSCRRAAPHCGAFDHGHHLPDLVRPSTAHPRSRIRRPGAAQCPSRSVPLGTGRGMCADRGRPQRQPVVGRLDGRTVERGAHADAAIWGHAHLRPQGRRRPWAHREADADHLVGRRHCLHRRLCRPAAHGPQARFRWDECAQCGLARRSGTDSSWRFLDRHRCRSGVRCPVVARREATRGRRQPSETLVCARHGRV